MSRGEGQTEMADFILSGGGLTVRGELRDEVKGEFQERCAELLDSGEDLLVLDLSGVEYMASCHLAIVLQLLLDAHGKRKELKTKVRSRLYELFELGHIHEVMDIEVVL